MRSPILLAFLFIAACHANNESVSDDADPDASTDAGPAWIEDPGLEGEPFRLDGPGCTRMDDRIFCGDVEYSTVDGTTLHLDLYAPLTALTTRVPAIMYVHGGGWSHGTHHGFGLPLDQYLAQGYAVLSIEYRLTLLPDRVTPSGITFPQNLQDVKTAVRWLRIKGAEFIDGDRIVAYGFSAGAHLVALAGDTAQVQAFEGRGNPAVPSTVAAVVALSAAIDFHLFVPENPPLDESCADQPPAHQTPAEAITLLIGAPFDDPANAQKLTDLSPMTYLDASAAPMLFFAGTCDQTVPYRGAEEIAELAQTVGAPQVDSFIAQGAFHGGTLGSQAAQDRLTAFLAAH